jgi:trimethylamine:corrinoid methyltransferase-like protein
LISRSTCQSTMRRATDFGRSSCGIESIRVRMRLNFFACIATRTLCRVAYFGDNIIDWLERGDSRCSNKFAN